MHPTPAWARGLRVHWRCILSGSAMGIGSPRCWKRLAGTWEVHEFRIRSRVKRERVFGELLGVLHVLGHVVLVHDVPLHLVLIRQIIELLPQIAV